MSKLTLLKLRRTLNNNKSNFVIDETRTLNENLYNFNRRSSNYNNLTFCFTEWHSTNSEKDKKKPENIKYIKRL